MCMGKLLKLKMKKQGEPEVIDPFIIFKKIKNKLLILWHKNSRI